MPKQVLRLSISLVIVTLLAMSGCADDANSNGPAGEPVASPTPEQPDDTRWAELLVTEKTCPQGEFEDPLFELAENEDEYLDLWAWFEIEDPHAAVAWDRQVVLFAGTGESGTCPLYLNDVEFHEEHRLITVDATVEDPEAMCTMDWTPRVFVIALDGETLGEGELRAMFFSEEHEQELDPDDGKLVREG